MPFSPISWHYISTLNLPLWISHLQYIVVGLNPRPSVKWFITRRDTEVDPLIRSGWSMPLAASLKYGEPLSRIQWLYTSHTPHLVCAWTSTLTGCAKFSSNVCSGQPTNCPILLCITHTSCMCHTYLSNGIVFSVVQSTHRSILLSQKQRSSLLIWVHVTSTLGS